jgi:regulator of cell morphogenesis and NO signaling
MMNLQKKAKDAGVEKPDLKEEFVKLREITDNYTVPDDVAKVMKQYITCWQN